MPGMKVKTEAAPPPGEKTGNERGDGEEEEEEEEKPALQTPRKRLINFKIPLVRGSQRRDQQQPLVRRLYRDSEEVAVDKGEGKATSPPLLFPRSLKASPGDKSAPSKPSERGYYSDYSDISSSEYFTSSESEGEEEGEESSEEESDVTVEPAAPSRCVCVM